MIFLTPRLLLRPLDPVDTPTLLHWLNSPKFVSALALDALKPRSRDSVKKLIESQTTKADTTLPFFAVCERPAPPGDFENLKLAPTEDLFVVKDAEGKEGPRFPMIGSLNIRGNGELSVTNRVVVLGVSFDQEYQGKGYGTELLLWAQRYVFTNLGLHRLELTVAATNTTAIRCYEKVGFMKEGVARKAFFRDGEWQDIIHMAVLEEEWWKRERKGEAGSKEYY